MYADKNLGAVSAGRDLFDCSPVQFHPFINFSATPRRGLIEDAMKKLGYLLQEEEERGWVVRDKDNLLVLSGEPNRLRATRAWWNSRGIAEVSEIRRTEMAWVTKPQAGRPARMDDGDDLEGLDNHPSRVQLRDSAYTRACSLWEECRMVLGTHIVLTERWMDAALIRELPRPDLNRRVGERRAVAHALRSLFDVERHNPVIQDALNGVEVTEAQIDEALLTETRALAVVGDGAGMCARMALATAIVMSTHSAPQVLKDLREVMLTFDLETTRDVEELCKSATT